MLAKRARWSLQSDIKKLLWGSDSELIGIKKKLICEPFWESWAELAQLAEQIYSIFSEQKTKTVIYVDTKKIKHGKGRSFSLNFIVKSQARKPV